MKSLLSIILIFFLISCKSHKSKVDYSNVRVPYENMAVHNTLKSSAVKDVEKEINYYRFKEDLSRTPVANISFDALPSKVIIDDLDIKHDDIYKLKKPKIKKKYTSSKKKKRKVRRKHRSKKQNKAHISKASHKKGYVDLSQKSKNHKTKSQNIQYQNTKKAQIASMKKNAQTVKKPVSQHKIPSKSHNVDSKATKEELEKKLNSLHARHSALVDNKAITNDSPHSNMVTAANPSQPPAVQMPQSGKSKATPSSSSTEGQESATPSKPSAEGKVSKKPQPPASQIALPKPPAKPVQESSLSIPDVPSLNKMSQVPDDAGNKKPPQPVAPAPVTSHETPKVVSSVKDPNSMVGIPPAPKIPSNFNMSSKSSVLQPVKPQNSTKGKKVIKIMKDLSLKKQGDLKVNSSDGSNSIASDTNSSKEKPQHSNDSQNNFGS